ncbi:AMP-binding protein, partial [Pseudoalteromonas piscicida]|uniref:AMP-binding protein n=1 Tax=Pseudoalteromonas piscicida TaxID=43662 RepID=UPI00110AB7D4
FENYPVDTLLSEKAKAAALKVTNVEGYEGTNYAITLKAHIEASLSIGCEVQGVIFDDAALESMLGHLHNLLMALTQSDATTTLAELTMLSDSELQTTLSSLAGAQPQQQEVQCIHARFEQHAATVGERTALICGSERLSYAALNRRANQLADYLLSHGLAQPGRLLGVCVQRSVELVVGILASLKAGCAYVPLDPAYPRARMAYLVEDAALEVILTDSEAQGQFEAGAVQALALDKLDCSAYSSENPDRTALGLSADALAYVIYTSGSTGQPKGVI